MSKREVIIGLICLATGILLMYGISHIAYPDTDDEPAYHSRDWDGDDSHRLAQLAMYYAYDMPTEDKILIINIAVNRVWSEDYPDTIEAVVDDMTDGEYADIEPDYDCVDAEHHVQIDGWDMSDGATEFEIIDRRIVTK